MCEAVEAGRQAVGGVRMGGHVENKREIVFKKDEVKNKNDGEKRDLTTREKRCKNNTQN